MAKYFIKTPYILRWISLCRVPKQDNKKIIYLSFDDGPHPDSTYEILRILELHNAKASFFCLGKQAKLYPELIQLIQNKSHFIGNHGYEHLNGWKIDSQTFLENLEKSISILGQKPFRAPYGKIKPLQWIGLKRKNIQIIGWDLMPGDFDPKVNAAECLKRLLKYSKNGSIIVLHDQLKTLPKLQYALPLFIEEFQKRGFEFKSLSIT
jgi:peptidoglycan/xylan/chitin deacetylase (PgdA/CDA1 family)